MLQKKIPILYLIISTIVGSSFTFFAFSTAQKTQFQKENIETPVNAAAANPGCNYNILRLSGYQYVHPVSGTDPDCPSPKYNTLENEILNFIEQEKAVNDLVSASVYINDFSQNEWMDVNENEQYHPGSLLKLASLITILRMAESKPGILNEEVLFPTVLKEGIPAQTFNSKAIQPGHKYKIKELLRYMIAFSDNNATGLLHPYLDVALFQKIFTDLNLPAIDIHDTNYQISVKKFSRFIRVLYDAGYLTISASEYAMSLLAEGDFNYGITKSLPPALKVAHKFGEFGNKPFSELHETALIYLDKRPYLITVMTRGHDVKKQAATIASISKMVYDKMSSSPN